MPKSEAKACERKFESDSGWSDIVRGTEKLGPSVVKAEFTRCRDLTSKYKKRRDGGPGGQTSETCKTLYISILYVSVVFGIARACEPRTRCRRLSQVEEALFKCVLVTTNN